MQKLLAKFIAVTLIAQLFLPSLSFAAHKDKHKTDEQASEVKLSVKDLPRHAWEDTKQSFWGTSGLLFLAGTGLVAGLHKADTRISNHFINDPKLGNGFDKFIGNALSPYTIGGANIAGYVLARSLHKPKLALAMESATEAWAGSMALTLAGKYAFNRKRPNGDNYSMPSAHTAAAFSTASVIADFYGWKAALPSYAIASLVGYTRLDHRNHYISDVAAGALLGSVLGWGCAQFHKKEHPNLFITPQVSNHQASLGIVKLF